MATKTEQKNSTKKLREQQDFRYNFLRIWGRRYAHMKARAEGRSTNKSHARGKEFMTKEEFFAWCKLPQNLDTFLVLWAGWSENNFKLWSSPSIDRIDPTLGYVAENIQWMEFSENCRKNHKSPIDHSDEDWG